MIAVLVDVQKFWLVLTVARLDLTGTRLIPYYTNSLFSDFLSVKLWHLKLISVVSHFDAICKF